MRNATLRGIGLIFFGILIFFSCKKLNVDHEVKYYTEFKNWLNKDNNLFSGPIVFLKIKANNYKLPN